ncbi:hypothetical protein GCM10027445_30490 [Amycolatopsis endophytica]
MEQQQRWLPSMAAGEAIDGFGLTEPDHGCDPGNMRTRVRRDGSDWVIDGRKMWIKNGSVGGAGSWRPRTRPVSPPWRTGTSCPRGRREPASKDAGALRPSTRVERARAAPR